MINWKSLRYLDTINIAESKHLRPKHSLFFPFLPLSLPFPLHLFFSYPTHQNKGRMKMQVQKNQVPGME